MTDESAHAKDQEEAPLGSDAADVSPEVEQLRRADQIQKTIGESDDANQLPSLDVESPGVERQAPALPYLVVAFGSSAGGLQAFRELLENLDPKTGMTFVLVPHLSPDHKSYLTEIIERYTRMPVLAVEDGVRPEPNHIYVLLPEQRLTLREGILRVEKRAVPDRGPMLIDQFFRSLAADQKNHAIGVILSGANSDGVLGLRAIKGEGGIALVQSPGTAEQSGMPRHSIAAGSVDLILSPAEIGAELGRLAHHFTRPDVRSLEPNEELHSTNEELETTNEELQSANEELQTVNDELQQRNNLLTQTGNDLTNLLNSVNIPLLMLTSDLQIRQFTPPMQRLLNVRPADIGRSISEIRLQLSIENIEPILNDVLDTLGTREMEVQDREGRWHLLRVRPYRTAENKIEGLVIVLFDIDQLRRSQEDLRDARDFATSVVEGVPVPIVVLKQDCSIRRVNTAFSDLAELPPKELEGRSLPELVQLLWGIQHLRERLDSLFASPGTRLEFEHESQTAHRKTLLITVQVLPTDGERVFLLMMQDITSRREAERRVSEQKAALESEVKVAALTLDRTKEELHGLTSHLFTVQEEEREHVARELHDDISQRLSGIEILLHEIQSDKSTQENAAKLESAKAELQSLNADVRQISHRLHPSILKDLGLSAALKSLVHEFGRRENMPATYVSRDLPESWADSAAIAIYRICQEALRNVAKHAGRTHVKVILEGLDRTLQFKVMDFGTGFDQESEHPPEGLGLISMKERARLAGGSFEVQSALGEGTTITVKIPVN